jgi:hypothetical protein
MADRYRAEFFSTTVAHFPRATRIIRLERDPIASQPRAGAPGGSLS